MRDYAKYESSCNALHLSRERDDCNLDATMKKVNAHGVIVTSGGGAS